MKITEKDKKEVTEKLIKKIIFKVNVIFGSNSKFGVFDKKIENLFIEIFPDLEALSWISLNDFGDLITETIEVIFENYREDLRFMYDNRSEDVIFSYHDRIGDMYVDKYQEFENSSNESMLKVMKYFCQDHNPSLQVVVNENKQGGCYIATMAYGDYNHPQVVRLRRFRDVILMPNLMGQRFVALYYKYSPKLVEILKPFKFIHKLVRVILNAFMILFRLD